MLYFYLLYLATLRGVEVGWGWGGTLRWWPGEGGALLVSFLPSCISVLIPGLRALLLKPRPLLFTC